MWCISIDSLLTGVCVDVCVGQWCSETVRVKQPERWHWSDEELNHSTLRLSAEESWRKRSGVKGLVNGKVRMTLCITKPAFFQHLDKLLLHENWSQICTESMDFSMSFSGNDNYLRVCFSVASQTPWSQHYSCWLWHFGSQVCVFCFFGFFFDLRRAQA